MTRLAGSVLMSLAALAALAVGPSATPAQAAVALDDAGTTPGSREIVFVDARIGDFRRLMGDREDRGRGRRQIETVVLAPGDDGLHRIGATLRQRRRIDAVHVFSHGTEGLLELGAVRLDAASLRTRGAEIARWGDALSPQGDLLLYGCNLAGGARGKRLVERLARLTRADVAASENPTGHRRLGGDWHLEYQTGPITVPVAVGETEQADWPGRLAITVNSLTTSNATSGAELTLSWSHTVNAGNNRVLLVGLALETGTATGVTYGGAPLVLVDRHTGANLHTIELWRLIAPAEGIANVVASFGVVAREALGGATTFNGVHQTSPTSGFAGNDGESDTASVTVTSVAGDLVVDTVFVDVGATITEDPSQSRLWSESNGRTAGGSSKPGAGSVPMEWGLSPSEEWTIAGVSLRRGPTISGVVFEDTAGDLLADGPIDGLNNPGLSSVDVYLYSDDGTTVGEPDAGDNLLEGPLTTDANGVFAFAEDSDGTYWVVVDSKSIVADAGLNPTWAATDVWAEQSYGPPGAVGYSGSYSFLGSAGAFYGGKQATVSDNAPGGLLASEHVARVVVSGASVNDVDFGFSFNIVTNVAAPDSGQNCCRSVQGSFDQFLQNSSAVDGPNTMRFVPAVPTNASGGGGNWWRIQHVLPVTSRFQFYDYDTIIDGTAHDSANGVTVLNTNPGNLGLNAAGGAKVGADEVALPQVAKPELEIFGRGFSPSFRNSAGTRSDRSVIRDLSAWGASAIFSSNGAIVPAVTLLDLRYENNVIGTPPDAFTDPGAGVNPGSCISFDSANSGHIVNNLIGFCDNSLIEGTRTSGWTITGNELRDGGAGGAPYDALRLGRAAGSSTANSFTIEENHIEGYPSNGIDSAQGGGHTIRNNTVVGHGSGGVETAGIRLATDGNLVDRNVIQSNTGPGVLVVGQDGGFPDSPAQQNQLTANHFGGNGGPGIDLVASGGSASLGDGPTPDDQTPPNCGYQNSGGNRLIDTPIVDTADLAGPTTNVTGRACASSTVELYRAAGDEGDLFVGSTTTDGGGNFSTGVTGLVSGDSVIAIVRDASGETSEFGAALVVSVPPADMELTQTDSPDPAPLDGPLVYTLLITNNGPGAATAVTVTDVLPASVTLVSATPSQGSCSGTTTVTCTLGAMVATGTASVEILVTTTATGTITNNASVTADETDPVAGNNAAAENTDVIADSAIFDLPLTQYRRIHGFVDYTVTGASLRTQANGPGGAACTVGPSASATLSGIPATATVSEALLYWAGSGATVDADVTFDGGSITADRTFQGRFSLGATDYEFFGGFEDVTAQVVAKRNASYSFADLTVDTADPYCNVRAVMAGWSLVVVYEDSALSGKTLVLYDGFDIERNGSSSYLLTGIYSADPPEAKTTFLTWEGDPDLAGVDEFLEFNGTQQSDGLNPANNVFNSTINSLGSTTSYGMDLDTFDVSSLVAPADTLATTQVSVGPDLAILNAVVLQVKSNLIAGFVFEDVNYGGGAGRNLATAAADAPAFTVGRGGVAVELYDAAGNFLRTTTTSASGEYGFTGLVDGTYQVRAVNDTVGSSRPGATGAELAVQTFRTDASSGTALPVTGKIGGAVPTGQDSPANVAMANLGTLTAQSVTSALITTGIAVPNVDFGYNFDTIVNTNDSGQGSLRQFILNSNLLTNANLDQDGLGAPLTEHSLFMIPSDADPYGRAKDPDFDAARGVAVILVDNLLDAITDADTAIDGTTQTAGVEDSNTAELGTGGTVGVQGLTLPKLNGPEVEIIDNADLLTGIDVQSNDVTVRGLAIYGFGPALNTGNIRVGLDETTNFTGVTVEDNVLGALADSFSDPDLVMAGSGTDGASIAILGADFGTLQRNLIGFSGRNAAVLSKAANDWTLEKNEFRGAGLDDARSDGLGLTEDVERGSVTGNLFAANQGAGVDFFSSVGDHTLTNNTFDGNGQGGVETAGVRMFGADGIIDRNVFINQVGSGVLAVVSDPAFPTANTPAIRHRITQNHFAGNGANSIDLQATLDIVAPGDGITLNDGTLLGDSSNPTQCGTDANHGNNGLDTPIVDLVLLGPVSSTVRGRACPGSEVEIYRAVADGDSSDTLGGNDYGEGVEYLATTTAAVGTGLFDISTVPGLSPGDSVSAISIDGDNNTSEFSANLETTSLKIVKRAFQSDGTPIASGSTLPSGMPVRFLLYIDNPSGVVSDASLQDVLDPLFAYQVDSMRVDNTLVSSLVCPGGVCDEAAIFAQVDGSGIALGDGDADADTGSYNAGTKTIDLGDGNNANNAQLDLAADRIWALVFTIRMQ